MIKNTIKLKNDLTLKYFFSLLKYTNGNKTTKDKWLAKCVLLSKGPVKSLIQPIVLSKLLNLELLNPEMLIRLW